MKDLNKFNIEIFKLSNGKHEYDFEIDETFFKHFENSPVENGKVEVLAVLDKRETLIEISFRFAGAITLTCDRSLDLFDFPINLSEKQIFKYGEEEVEIDDEISMITKQTQRINVAQFIYESICLSIPFKKLHPRYKDSAYEEEEGTMIYRDKAAEDTEEEAGNTDPRWDILKNLKNN